MHTSEYRVLGVCLLALTTIGLCGCPLGGGNQETPPPATEPGFIVRTWATTIIGGEPLEPSRRVEHPIQAQQHTLTPDRWRVAQPIEA